MNTFLVFKNLLYLANINKDLEMKKLFCLLISTLITLSSYSQEIEPENAPGQEPTLVERLTHGKTVIKNVEMNLQLFTSANANFVDNSFDDMNFKLNRLRLEIKGNAMKNLTYHFRQSFNKYSNPYSVDNLSSSLELAYLNLNIHNKFGISVGKQFVNLGGYEYYVNAIRIREFSEFNNLLTCYQAGVSGYWYITPSQELSFQIMNNKHDDDSKIYPSGLPEGYQESKVPFMYVVNWNSSYFNNVLQLRYAAAMGQQAKGKYSYYLTFGNIIEKGPLLAYIDVMYTRQSVDQHSMISYLPTIPKTAANTEYLSVIADIDYRFHPRWNAYIKGAYETARVYQSNGAFEKGLYRTSWNIQGSVEYTPFKKSDLFVFIHYTYRGIDLKKPALTLGATDPDTHRISLGLVYAIPIF